MSKWLEKKIAERQTIRRKQKVRKRKKITSTVTEPDSDSDLLNRLLDEWEEREYGSKR